MRAPVGNRHMPPFYYLFTLHYRDELTIVQRNENYALCLFSTEPLKFKNTNENLIFVIYYRIFLVALPVPTQHHNIAATSLQWCDARWQCCNITLQRRCRFSPMSAFAILQVCIFAKLRQHYEYVVLQRSGNDSATKRQNCGNDAATLRQYCGAYPVKWNTP